MAQCTGVCLFLIFVIFMIFGPAARLVSALKTEHFLVVRADNRDCASPYCGGYWIAPLNVVQYVCPSTKKSSTSCYVSRFAGATTVETGDIVKGGFVAQNGAADVFEFQPLAVFQPASRQAVSTGTFYTITSIGSTFHGREINQDSLTRTRAFYSNVDLSSVPLDSPSAVLQSMQSFDVIVSAKTVSVGDSISLLASNVYTPAVSQGSLCLTSKECVKNQFCSKPYCGAKSGYCTLKPISCAAQNSPVCACDGKRSFASDCMRRMVGAIASTPGACQEAS